MDRSTWGASDLAQRARRGEEEGLSDEVTRLGGRVALPCAAGPCSACLSVCRSFSLTNTGLAGEQKAENREQGSGEPSHDDSLSSPRDRERGMTGRQAGRTWHD